MPRARSAWFVLAALAVAGPVRAENDGQRRESGATERAADTHEPKPTNDDNLRFSADRLTLDPKLQRLDLQGHVLVAVDRYRLRGHRLAVSKMPGEILVSGPGNVALCPCPDPPVTVGFSSARILPPGDLVLRNPTLQVGGVPIAWLPYFWLRSPRRWGLLPVKVAYRGDDGLLLGSGVHVPLGAADEMDLRAAAYVKGGVDLEARVATSRSESAVRWDYLGDSLVGVDARGAIEPLPGASAAWDVDALRGSRALTGPVLIEEAALRQDRARGAIGVSSGPATFALLGAADTARGGPLDRFGSVGPGVFLGAGSALGHAGSVDADIQATSLHDAFVGSTTIVDHHGELRVDDHAGPLLVTVQGRTRAVLTIGERSVGHVGAVGLAAEVSVPLVRRFGGSESPLEHWITPFFGGTVGITHAATPTVLPALAPNGAFGIVAPGIRTIFGERAGRRSALTVSIEGGAFAGDDGNANGVIAAEGIADERPFSFHEESVFVSSVPHATVNVFQARAGSLDAPFVAVRLHESRGVVPELTRFAFSRLDGGWDAAWVPWLGSSGSSVGGRLGVPWAGRVTTLFESDYDASSRALLGVRGSLAYLHPCRCLRVFAWVGERLGRRGLDAFLAVDLVP